MSQQDWAAQALQSFDTVVQSTEGLCHRDGQRHMAELVAHTFAHAQLGKVGPPADAAGAAPAPQRAIAVVQAGTGVGKSLAYSAPAIAAALARGTRVLVSTATVALQEQLVHKDLPALAARMPQSFQFALAKGRGRYVCQLKLERLSGMRDAGDDSPEDDLYAHEEAAARPDHETEARGRFYATMVDALARGAWNGDRDTLESPPEPEVWGPVAAEASACTGKHCPAFDQCAYYDRRKALATVQVIVANHDLLLSTLGTRQLPELDNCLLVIDEAHHLPSTALERFACEADLSRLTWIDKLASRALRIGTLVEVEEAADAPNHCAHLRAALQTTARIVMDAYGSELRMPQPAWNRGGASRMPTADRAARARVAGGTLPEALVESFEQVAHSAAGFLQALRAIAKALRTGMRDTPGEARRLSTLYAQIGTLAPRLEGVHDTAQRGFCFPDACRGANRASLDFVWTTACPWPLGGSCPGVKGVYVDRCDGTLVHTEWPEIQSREAEPQLHGQVDERWMRHGMATSRTGHPDGPDTNAAAPSSVCLSVCVTRAMRAGKAVEK